MRSEVYNFLVNKRPGICYRYHKVHDGAAGIQKIISWIYLLWLNVAYYVFFCHFLGKTPEVDFYEKKRLSFKISESEAYQKETLILSVDEFTEKIKKI